MLTRNDKIGIGIASVVLAAFISFMVSQTLKVHAMYTEVASIVRVELAKPSRKCLQWDN